MLCVFLLTDDFDVFLIKNRCFSETPYFPFYIMPLFFKTDVGFLDENPRDELTIFLDIFLTK